MSEAALAENPADRRQHARRQVQRTAELILRDQPAHHACTILDQSNGGVQLRTEFAAFLPEEAIIKFSDTASQLVRRCWAMGDRAGYQFVEVVPVQRNWLNEDAAPQQVDILALNNFVAISRTLLNLFNSEPECLHSIEQVCARLTQMPLSQVQLPEPGTAGETLQLITIPRDGLVGLGAHPPAAVKA